MNSDERCAGLTPNKNPPIIVARGRVASVPHMFVARTPAVAEALFNLKIEATIKVVATPSPGKIPKKTPRAAPPAILCGESSSEKKC